MTRYVTPPMSRIPIGLIDIGGQRMEVAQHPEFTRWFTDLQARVGGVSALSNADLAALTLELAEGKPQATTSLEAIEALRAVDELRNEIGTLRADNNRLRTELDELRAQMEDHK